MGIAKEVALWLQKNCNRSGCRDIFHAFLFKNATYEGLMEMPCLKKETAIPESVILFSKAISSTNYKNWICFYEDDAAFERLWNNPRKYLPILKRFEGVISPDFSLYRDMPLGMQVWNILRGRALARWLQENGVRVIPNIRWGDKRTFKWCCDGIPHGCPIAIGTHGCVKLLQEREPFKEGVKYVVNVIHPTTIVIYGTVPDFLRELCTENRIKIRQFDSEYAITHRKKEVV